MNEKLYLFNPFLIKDIEDKELKKIYAEVFEQINNEASTMYELAHNVEVYSNLEYIIGEIIARITKEVLELKMKIKIDTAINTTKARKEWNDGKPPAMSYFEAVATQISQDDINMLAFKECSLSRFKNAYKSIEEKINAIKRKMEAVKFEEFNQ